MKNTYINPVINVVALRQQQSLLAGSVQGSLSNETTNIAYGRDFDFEDDED
ncbi:MAG: toxin PIN [Prevotella sp.]|nr:toxin PIN [Prevotella sp.]